MTKEIWPGCLGLVTRIRVQPMSKEARGGAAGKARRILARRVRTSRCEQGRDQGLGFRPRLQLLLIGGVEAGLFFIGQGATKGDAKVCETAVRVGCAPWSEACRCHGRSFLPGGRRWSFEMMKWAGQDRTNGRPLKRGLSELSECPSAVRNVVRELSGDNHLSHSQSSQKPSKSRD